MKDEQPLGRSLRESGVKLGPPYPKPLTVGHKIQRVWSLLFGKNQDDLIPVWCNLGGAISVVPVPLTDMVYVDSGTLTDGSLTALAGWVDLLVISCWGEVPSMPKLAGKAGDSDTLYEGDISVMGGAMDAYATKVFPVELRLHAHVNQAYVTNTQTSCDIRFRAYRHKLR